MSDTSCKNTDKELWQEKEDDYYSPRISVTEQGKIQLHVGGAVVSKDIREWVGLDKRIKSLEAERDTWKANYIGLCEVLKSVVKTAEKELK